MVFPVFESLKPEALSLNQMKFVLSSLEINLLYSRSKNSDSFLRNLRRHEQNFFFVSEPGFSLNEFAHRILSFILEKSDQFKFSDTTTGSQGFCFFIILFK